MFTHRAVIMLFCESHATAYTESENARKWACVVYIVHICNEIDVFQFTDFLPSVVPNVHGIHMHRFSVRICNRMHSILCMKCIGIQHDSNVMDKMCLYVRHIFDIHNYDSVDVCYIRDFFR